MASQKTWRCAIVGVGMAGESHVRALKKVPNATLVAVCDSDNAKAVAALAKHGVSVPIHPDLKTLFDKEKIDVLHIALPSSFHRDAAIEAMERGVNVIIEKPLDITLERCDAIIAAAARHKVKLAGIYQNRFNPSNRMVKSAIAEGRFGPLTWAGAFVLWVREPKYYQSWRGTKDIDGGGAIMNNSIHSIDLLQWMVGPIASVSAYADARVHKQLEVEDTLTCALRFGNGALGTIVGTTGMFPGRPARIEIGGFNGTAVIEGNMKEFKFREVRPGDEDALKPPGEQPDLQALNITHILQSRDAGKEPETSGPECRKSVQIVLAMYESAKNGARQCRFAGETSDKLCMFLPIAMQPTLSICVPVYNEEENLPLLHEAIVKVLDANRIDGEILLVDDGSKDGSWAAIEKLVARDPRVRGLKFSFNCGETAASDAGLRAARGRYVMTMDADLQNDPADIPAFLKALGEGWDCVCGTRVATRGKGDTFVRVMSSRIANWVRNKLSDEQISDAGCTYRAFKRGCVDKLKLYRGLHRFIPTLLKMEGFTVAEIPVTNNPRLHGESKYGVWNRLFKSFRDLLAIRWMKSRLLGYQIGTALDRTSEIVPLEQKTGAA